MADPGDPRPESAGPPGTPGSGRARANAVLIVEDQPELLRALRINLRARQYDVVTARTGREALALAASQPPDAVILRRRPDKHRDNQIALKISGQVLVDLLMALEFSAQMNGLFQMAAALHDETS